ncbi:MAG: Mg2+/Co2+ transporter [Gammaproteobacteria bacterium]|nr:MAG: Mg2+/Co2+ transporter [Gammaproteobacteria bacterium]
MKTPLAHAIDALNEDYIRRFNTEAVRTIGQMRVADIAELLETRSVQVAIQLWQQLPIDIAATVLMHMQFPLAVQLVRKADAVRIAQCLARLDDEQRHHLLAPMNVARRDELLALMQYPYDCAGALMTLRRQRLDQTRQVFLRDEAGRLAQVADIQDLALADPLLPVDTIARPARTAVLATASREEVVELIEKHKLTDLPVIDVDGEIVGVIHHDALVRAVREETSEDLLTMVGVSTEERALSRVGFVVRKRLPWLQINLLTAFLAASVVAIFENTIAQFTALAVLLPVVAGQSGNTGAQALAVTMRALALREISTSHWWRVARKELGAGFFNGTAVALTTSLGVAAWSGSWGLALVIAIAMVLSMVIAGFVGVVIPITLKKIGQDPAQSASIILTTVTDVAGFFSFLGIATLLAGLL